MRIAIDCAFCAPHEKRPVPLDVELTDDLYLKFTCDNGHKNLRFVETERFSVLFDLGMFALEDGYSREAVANFAASMERMHEFYIRVVCKKHSIPDDMVRDTWKQVANQSERQLGAFSFLYLLETKKNPPPLPMVDFRNKLIHKGYIPSYAQSLDYGKIVHEYMTHIVAQMNRDAGRFVVEAHADQRKKVTDGKHNSNMSFKHYIPFGTTYTKYYKMTLEEKMRKRKSYRWLLAGSWPIESREQVNNLIGAAMVIARQTSLTDHSMELMVADASDLEAE